MMRWLMDLIVPDRALRWFQWPVIDVLRTQRRIGHLYNKSRWLDEEET